MSESLKIAFYTDTFLPATDGVVTAILNFRKELTKRGHDVYIFASGDSYTRQIAKKQKNIFVVRGVKFRKYPQYNLAFFPFVSTIKVTRMKIDVIHSHTPFMMGFYALLLSKMNKIPITSTFHTLFTDKSVIKEYTINNKRINTMVWKYSWRYARFYYNRCNSVIAPSDTVRKLLARKGIKAQYIVPSGVDLKRFNSQVNGDKIRDKLVKNRKDKVVLYIGRLSKEKRLDTLLEAARILKNQNITFLVGGTGPAAHHYQKLAERMHIKDKVRFLGFVEDKKLPQYYAACDVFCLPSKFETQGMVALEAMACDKPVVGSDYLALKELIKNGKNGERFIPGNGTSCARKIEEVLYNRDSYKEMVNTAKQYSVEKTTDELLNVYKKLIYNT